MAAGALAEKDDVRESVFQGKESFRGSGAGTCVFIEISSPFFNFSCKEKRKDIKLMKRRNRKKEEEEDDE